MIVVVDKNMIVIVMIVVVDININMIEMIVENGKSLWKSALKKSTLFLFVNFLNYLLIVVIK
ncbi:hypothetical protein CN354_22350 [Bacillus cereus]|nr:hypothetical protein CN354_22350 [Bacillus cereus]